MAVLGIAILVVWLHVDGVLVQAHRLVDLLVALRIRREEVEQAQVERACPLPCRDGPVLVAVVRQGGTAVAAGCVAGDGGGPVRLGARQGHCLARLGLEERQVDLHLRPEPDDVPVALEKIDRHSLQLAQDIAQASPAGLEVGVRPEEIDQLLGGHVQAPPQH